MNYNNKFSGAFDGRASGTLQNHPQGIEEALRSVFGDKAAGAVLRQDGQGTCGPAPVRSALATVDRLAALGVRVDASPVDHGAHLTGEDEWIMDRVSALPPAAAGLVIHYAETRSRPELVEDLPRFVPVTLETGRPMVVYRDPVGKRGPLFCPVEQDPLPEHREFCRDRWRLWWDALDLLAVQCGCTPPAVAREPWINPG